MTTVEFQQGKKREIITRNKWITWLIRTFKKVDVRLSTLTVYISMNVFYFIVVNSSDFEERRFSLVISIVLFLFKNEIVVYIG